jgi:hypothetical protein
LVEATDARLPTLLELRQQAIGPAHGVRIAGHTLGTTVLPFGHQLRTFQNGHVLLHGGKRHRVLRRQLADGGVGVHHARQNVAPGGIGQRPEHQVEVVGRGLLIYNHMVVDSNTPDKNTRSGSGRPIRGLRARLVQHPVHRRRIRVYGSFSKS